MGNSLGGSSTAVLRALAAGVDPEGYFRRRGASDDPFVLRFPGLGEVLFVSSKEGAREVLTAPTSLCRAPTPNPIEPIVGERSLILLSGERHRRTRGLLMPALNGERMRAYVDVIAEATAEEIATLRSGDTVAVRKLAQAIALDVIIRVVFGVTDHERRHEYAVVIEELMRANTTALMLVPRLRREIGGRGPWARLVRLRNQLDQLVSEDIERRRAEDLPVSDMLDLILSATDEDGQGLCDEDMHQQLRTLLAAGHETSATSLTWALYHIHRDDAIRERVLAELADRPSPREFAALPYLNAVIAETLRMHPTVSIVLRRLTAPFTVRGVDCPEGAIIGVALPALHFNPDIWAHPARFDPERFLIAKPSPFEYAPFGGGYRRCIGASFARYELAVSIGTIMSTLELEMPEHARRRTPPRAVARGIATVPNREIELEVIGRTSTSSPAAGTAQSRPRVRRG
jgi:cytochrome P450